MSQAPAARSLGDVLADIQRHRDTCAAEQVPTSSDKLLELHSEALRQVAHAASIESRVEMLEADVAVMARRLDALEAGQAKPAATKTTKRAG